MDWRPVQQVWATAWSQRAMIDVVTEARMYDIRTYNEYLRWYLPRTRATLIIRPPDRPEQDTNEDIMERSIDRHSASRHHDALDRAQSIATVSESALSSPDTPPAMHKTLKFIMSQAKKIVHGLSLGRSTDRATRIGHVEGPPCSPAGTSRASESSHPSQSTESARRRRSCVGRIDEQVLRRDASLPTTTPPTQSTAPPRSSSLHIREPSIQHEGDVQSSDDDTALPDAAREQYAAPGFAAYAGGSSAFTPFGGFGDFSGQSSSGFAGASYGQGHIATAPTGGFLHAFVQDMLSGGPHYGMSQQEHIDAYQYTVPAVPQPTGPPPATQQMERSPYLLRTDTRAPDRLSYPTGHARAQRKTRARTGRQTRRGDSTDSDD